MSTPSTTTDDNGEFVFEFAKEKHIQFFLQILNGLPEPYQSQEINRLTLAYFAISGLDLLNGLDLIEKDKIIEWVYSLQVVENEDRDSINSEENDECMCYGFRGSPSIGIKYNSNGSPPLTHYDGSNIASTYSALCILLILGDDLKRLRKEKVIKSVKALQQEDGSFSSVLFGGECDIRFVFCAIAICVILNDFSEINVEKMVSFLFHCQSYDFGFGLNPGAESHGGATYCALSSILLLERFANKNVFNNEMERKRFVHNVIRWTVMKQNEDGGISGRTNKISDSCYSFWIGGNFQILNSMHFFNEMFLQDFLLFCQNEVIGGFSKTKYVFPDALHAYCSVCGLALIQKCSLSPLYPQLGISLRAKNHLISLFNQDPDNTKS